MKHGNSGTIDRLVERVQAENIRKHDFISPTGVMTASDVYGEPRLNFRVNRGSDETTSFNLEQVAHENLSQLCGIDMRYYRKLLELPSKELWATNVNQWLPGVSNRTVRTFDGEYEDDLGMRSTGSVRCLMSDRYWCLDNSDLLAALIPQFEKRELTVLTSNLSERHMVIKAVSPKMIAEVPHVGDRVQGGIAVGNSEVGQGSLWITEYDYVLSCTNGMVGEKERKYTHRSGKSGEDDSNFSSYSSETKRKTNEAFWAQIAEDIDRCFDEERFAGRVSNYGDAAADEVHENQEARVISTVCSESGVPKDDWDKVLRHYHRGGQENRWGVAQAVTRYAQDVEDFDLATSLESAGRKVMDGGLYR